MPGRRLVATMRRAVALRELNASPGWRRMPAGRIGRAPIALVYGNCQAEALRRILLSHPGMARTFHLLRVPAVHEITRRELALIQRLLPRVEVLIAQPVKSDYRDMPLGTEQVVDRIARGATVVRYPVAFFEGVFPFHVYVNRDAGPIASSAPITDYHDLRILHAAGQGWDAATTTAWLAGLRLDPGWIRRNAEASLAELGRREAELTVRLSAAIQRPENLTTSFHTINHPTNTLVTQLAQQVLAHLGYGDAERVRQSRQTYLDHLKAPREPQILRALGTEPDPAEPQTWCTSAGTYSMADVVEAHLGLYAADPQLLAAGLAKHRDRLAALTSVLA